MVNRTELEKVIAKFNPATIEELDRKKLLTRFDTKFILPSNRLHELLQCFVNDYKIIELKNKRSFIYENDYFDTDELFFYTQHHNGRLKRQKIRFRHYKDANTFFLEIKHRTNDGKTSKDRIETQGFMPKINESLGKLVLQETSITPELLQSKINISYERITLMSNINDEKVTFDTNLRFQNNDIVRELHDLTIIEVKQKKFTASAESINFVKDNSARHIKRLSKYCLGMILTRENIKYNRFKSKLLAINKLTGNNNERISADGVVLV